MEHEYFEIPKSRVFVKTDDQGRIVRCEGEYSLENCMVEVDTGEFDEFGHPITVKEIDADWALIDEGYGDKFSLAQSHYFHGGLYTTDGIPKYKLVNGTPELRTNEEIEIDKANIPTPPPSDHERIETLEETKADKSDVDAVWDSMAIAYQEGVNEV